MKASSSPTAPCGRRPDSGLLRDFPLVLPALAALAFFSVPGEARARSPKIFYVNASRTADSGDGESWANAKKRLQSALALATTAGDQIRVAEGIYYPDEGTGQTEDNRNSTFTLKKGVKLYGGYAGVGTTRDTERRVTVLSGDLDQNDEGAGEDGIIPEVKPGSDGRPVNLKGSNAYHVVDASNADADSLLDGFTITAGLADGATNDDTRTLSAGGGVFALAGASPVTLKLNNCVVSGNAAFSASSDADSEGGGIGVITSSSPSPSPSSVELTNCRVTGNTALASSDAFSSSSGGGIHVVSVTIFVALTNCLVSGNSISPLSASSSGGGIYCFSDDASSVALTNCRVTGNAAASSSSFSHHFSSGGGIYVSSHSKGPSVALTNCLVSGNSLSSPSAYSGGGIYLNSPSKIIRNTIIRGNSPDSILISEGNPAPTYQNCLVDGVTGDGILADADPLFIQAVPPSRAPTTAGDYRLAAGSPALNAGDSSLYPGGASDPRPATDLAGKTRIQGGMIDLGPYEGAYQPFAARNLRITGMSGNTATLRFERAAAGASAMTGLALESSPDLKIWTTVTSENYTASGNGAPNSTVTLSVSVAASPSRLFYRLKKSNQ